MTPDGIDLENVMELLGVHAEGEVGRVIVSGAPEIPGATMAEKMTYINTVDDSLVKRCLYEPRGTAQMSVNLLVPPCREDADMGFLPLQPDGAHAMSGSNAMCVVTALLEAGMIPPKGPDPVIRLDTPAGLVEARTAWTGTKVERVEIDMPVSFVEHLDHPLEVKGLGTIRADVAFGGCYFALIDAAAAGFELVRDEARDLVDVGMRIQDAAVEQIAVRHPELPGLESVEYPMFITRTATGIRNVTIIFPGRVDRSPCGTGTVARLAVMYQRGELRVGDEISSRSIIDGEFLARLVGTTRCGDRVAVRTTLSGRAWIYGRYTLGVHPTDPFQLGYTLPDVWGSAALREPGQPDSAVTLEEGPKRMSGKR